MRRFKALVIGVEDGTIGKIDGLEYEGKLWIVPQWCDIPAKGVTKPARLIRFDTLPHQVTPNSQYGVDFVLNSPIPKELFDLQTPKQAIPGFEFLEMPEIEFPMADKTKN
jgi:hypothetical protein